MPSHMLRTICSAHALRRPRSIRMSGVCVWCLFLFKFCTSFIWGLLSSHLRSDKFSFKICFFHLRSSVVFHLRSSDCPLNACMWTKCLCVDEHQTVSSLGPAVSDIYTLSEVNPDQCQSINVMCMGLVSCAKCSTHGTTPQPGLRRIAQLQGLSLVQANELGATPKFTQVAVWVLATVGTVTQSVLYRDG